MARRAASRGMGGYASLGGNAATTGFKFPDTSKYTPSKFQNPNGNQLRIIAPGAEDTDPWAAQRQGASGAQNPVQAQNRFQSTMGEDLRASNADAANGGEGGYDPQLIQALNWGTNAANSANQQRQGAITNGYNLLGQKVGGLLSADGSDAVNSQKAFNTQNAQNWGALGTNIQGQLAGSNNQRMADIGSAYDAQGGQMQARLAQQGLQGTTVGASMQAGNQAQRQAALDAQNQSFAQLQAGYGAQIGEGGLNAGMQGQNALQNINQQYDLTNAQIQERIGMGQLQQLNSVSDVGPSPLPGYPRTQGGQQNQDPSSQNDSAGMPDQGGGKQQQGGSNTLKGIPNNTNAIKNYLYGGSNSFGGVGSPNNNDGSGYDYNPQIDYELGVNGWGGDTSSEGPGMDNAGFGAVSEALQRGLGRQRALATYGRRA